MRRPSSTQRILITGASRGIGRATAIALAARGHRVVLAARDEGALRDAAAEIERAGGSAEIVVMDLTDDGSVQTAVTTVLQSGPCDMVINNAGSCLQREFLAGSHANRREEFELNYWGAHRVSRAVLPSMVSRGEGTIVNVSSLLGSIACPTAANYCASKAALEAWSHALRGEVARFGVRIVVFMAPHTQTDLGRRTEFDGVVSLPVAYTVKELLRAVERKPRFYAASPVYRMFLRIAALFPAFMEARVAASVQSKLLPNPLLTPS